MIEVFDWFTDLTNLAWVPLVHHITPVRPGSQATNGVGAVRKIVSPLWRLTEEIIEYRPPRLLRYRVIKAVPRLNHEGGCLTHRDCDYPEMGPR